MSAMLCTRHDICYVIDIASQFLSNSDPDRWTAVKNVLMYLWITRKYSLVFLSRDLKMPECADSDFQADRDSRMSASRYMFTLNGRSATWRSVEQSWIADSTIDAVYVAAYEVARRLYSFASSLCIWKLLQILNSPWHSIVIQWGCCRFIGT